MTTKSEERKLFNRYRKSLISQLGPKALDDAVINKLGKSFFSDSWGGVFPIDRVKLEPEHYYVVNTDPHDKPGEHWLAVRTTKARAYVYDSYGRNPRQIASHLIKTIQHSGYKLSATDLVPHMEQRGYSSEVCGHDSLSWLLVARDLGIARARNI